MNFSILILLCITIRPSLLYPDMLGQQSITDNSLTRASSSVVGYFRGEDEVQNKSYMEVAQDKFYNVLDYIPFLSRVPIWRRMLMYTKLCKNTTMFFGRAALYAYSWVPFKDHTSKDDKMLMWTQMRVRLTPATEVEIPPPSIIARVSKPVTVPFSRVLAQTSSTAEYFTVFEKACVLCIMSQILNLKRTLINYDTNKISQWAVYDNKENIKRTIASMFKFRNDTSMKKIFLSLHKLYQNVNESKNIVDEEYKEFSKTFKSLEEEFQNYLNFTFRISWLGSLTSDHEFSDYVTIIKILLEKKTFPQTLDNGSTTKFENFLNMCTTLMRIFTDTTSLNKFMKILDQETPFNENEEHFLELINFTFTSSLVNKKEIKYISKKPSIFSFVSDPQNKDKTDGIGGKLQWSLTSVMSRVSFGTTNSNIPSRSPSIDNENEGSTNTGIEKTSLVPPQQIISATNAGTEKTSSSLSQQNTNGPINGLILQHFNTVLCVFNRFVTLTTGTKPLTFINNPDKPPLSFISYLFQEYIEILEWTRQFESMTDQITGINEGQKYVEAFVNTFAFYTLQFRSVIVALIDELDDIKVLLTNNEDLYRVYRIFDSNKNPYLEHIIFPSRNLVDAAKRSFQLKFDSQANCETLDVTINFETLNVVDLKKKPIGSKLGLYEEMDAIKLQRMNSQQSLKHLLQIRNYNNTDNLFITKVVQASALSILYPIKRKK